VAATDDEFEAVIEETLRRAGKAYVATGSLPVILLEADKQLAAKLGKVVDKQGADVRFSDASALLFRSQIKLVQQYVNKRLLGLTHEKAKEAIAIGTKDTIALTKSLEKRFTGVAIPLAIDVQGWLDANVRGTGASLLRQHQTSVDRYGQRMIADFEKQLRVGLMLGLSNSELVSRLVEAGKHGGINAGKLHEATPGHFPKPTSYVKRRYWAERIVRTEVAFAHNAAALSSINELRVTQFPDMAKKILAHFDNRTAPDSVAVHGQVRKVDEYFMDGAGRQYLHPPGRPNDRETIVPWRLSWKELPNTASQDPKETKPQAPVPPKGPEASPNTLWGDILSTNEKVKAQKAAKAEAETKASNASAATAALDAAAKAKLKEAIAAQKAASIARAKALKAAQKAAAAEQLKLQKQAEQAKAKAEKEQAKAAAKAAKAAAIERLKAQKAAAQAAKVEARRAARQKQSLSQADDALKRAERAWAQAKTLGDKAKILADVPREALAVDLKARTHDGGLVDPAGIASRSAAFGKSLPDEQRRAIQSFGGALYTAIRQSEAAGAPSAASDLIHEALKQGTPEKGLIVWRGIRNIPLQAFDSWLAGKPFMLGENGGAGTSSTSWNQGVSASSFAGLDHRKAQWGAGGGEGPHRNRVLFRLRNARGVAIEEFAPWSTERELVQPRDARFVATKIYQIAPHCYVVEADGLED
jgi:hypothetical protein